MKIAIYHNSATGHTLYQAQSIKAEIQKQQPQWQVDLIWVHPILNKLKNGQKYEQPEYDAFILGSWVNCFTIDINMERFVNLLDLSGKPVASFTTHGGANGVSGLQLQRLINKKHGLFAGHMTCRFVSNNFHKPKNGKAMTISPEVQAQVPRFVEALSKCIEAHKRAKGMNVLVWLLVALFVWLVRKLSPKLAKLMSGKAMKVETVKCVGCMKCVNECPNAVFAAENGKAKAVHTADCTLCLGCVHRCPAGAITSIEGKLDNFQPYKFQEYYINEQKGWVEIEKLQQDFKKKQ